MEAASVPAQQTTAKRPRSKGKTAGDTESKPSRPKADHRGQGRKGAKERRAAE